MRAVDGLEFKLPALGDAETATIGRWRRQTGERVAAREPLLEAYSPRFDWDIPAPGAGVLEAVHAPAGNTVKPGDTVAIFRPDGAAPALRVRISPLAAKWAAANAVALEHVAGSGAGGRIVRADVQARTGAATA